MVLQTTRNRSGLFAGRRLFCEHESPLFSGFGEEPRFAFRRRAPPKNFAERAGGPNPRALAPGSILANMSLEPHNVDEKTRQEKRARRRRTLQLPAATSERGAGSGMHLADRCAEGLLGPGQASCRYLSVYLNQHQACRLPGLRTCGSVFEDMATVALKDGGSLLYTWRSAESLKHQNKNASPVSSSLVPLSPVSSSFDDETNTAHTGRLPVRKRRRSRLLVHMCTMPPSPWERIPGRCTT